MQPSASMVACAAVLALAGCATNQKCGMDQCAGDAQISAAVRASLEQHPELGPPNRVDVKTREGVVFLSGQVATDLQRQTAESAARSTAGVRKVNDTIALTYGR